MAVRNGTPAPLEVLILAAGAGRKFFPYDEALPKALRKVAGIPLFLWNVQALRRHTDAPIRVLTRSEDAGAVRDAAWTVPNVTVQPVESAGTAQTALAGLEAGGAEEVVILYGDTVAEESDLVRLLESPSPTVLVYPLRGEPARNVIACAVENGRIGRIGAHDRGDAMTHRFGGFRVTASFREALRRTPAYFPDVKVGVSPPREPYLEAALAVLTREEPLPALEGRGEFYDVDKPWQLLEANEALVHRRCAALERDELAPGSTIHPTAQIHGRVRLGRNSVIGPLVRVEGSLIVGDNTSIDQGALFLGDCVVGGHCSIRNYCQVYGGCSIGEGCIVDHCAELLGGMLMDKVYLYHYGEYYGCIGSCADVGAGTVCGTLRFDDREAPQRVLGRWEPAEHPFSSAVYLGDYVRTGVHATLMPGVKVGCGSVVGPGVLVEEDLPPHTCLRLRQELLRSPWGPERYGW